MIYFRIGIFVIFASALYLSVDCLLDVERVTEHNGAWFAMFISVCGCSLSAIDPYKLL